MDELRVKVDGDHVSLNGDIVYQTVVSALKQKIFSHDVSTDRPISVDFSGVGHADSSGLALMVHWVREAKMQNLSVEFTNIPKKLISLAEMSNLEEVLPISR